MVGIEHQCVAGLEGERVLVFLFCKDIIGGAELFDGGIVQTSTFLHLAAMRSLLPLISAISGLMFLRHPTVSVSAEMLPE